MPHVSGNGPYLIQKKLLFEHLIQQPDSKLAVDFENLSILNLSLIMVKNQMTKM